MCVCVAGWLAGLAGWLTDQLFLSYFFPSSSSSSSPPSAINLFLLKKHKSRKKIQHKFRTFFFKKKFYTERREGDCYGGVLVGGSSAGPELRQNVCSPTSKQTAMAPASGRGRSDLCSQNGDDPTIKI
jgi:hypothetical protein